MRILRLLAAAVLAAVAAATVVHIPLERHRCNAEKKAAEQFIDHAGTMPSELQRRATAERHAEQMERCAASTPSDWQVFFFLGTLQSIAGRDRLAIASYEKAAQLEERPEIYYSMSVIQLEAGQMQAALANAEKAALFSLGFAEEYDKHLRDTLYGRFFARQEALRARKGE